MCVSTFFDDMWNCTIVMLPHDLHHCSSILFFCRKAKLHTSTLRCLQDPTTIFEVLQMCLFKRQLCRVHVKVMTANTSEAKGIPILSARPSVQADGGVKPEGWQDRSRGQFS